MKKLILQMNGGLGNQLFQYHAGFLYSEIHKCDLYLDFSRSLNDKAIRRRRNLGMDLRGIQEFSLPRGKTLRKNFVTRLVFSNKFLNLFGSTSLASFIDFSKNGEVGENLKIHDLEQNPPSRALTRLKGNFQSYEVLSSAIDRGSISELELINQSINLKSVVDFLAQGESLALHIRLTDYITQATSSLINTNYYASAFENATSNREFKHIWIFSDDIKLAKRILPSEIIGKVTKFVSEKELSDAESLFLMSKFDSLIISNSTFSYFAAFYGRLGITVYAPSVWFINEKHEITLQYPPKWNIVEFNTDI